MIDHGRPLKWNKAYMITGFDLKVEEFGQYSSMIYLEEKTEFFFGERDLAAWKVLRILSYFERTGKINSKEALKDVGGI